MTSPDDLQRCDDSVPPHLRSPRINTSPGRQAPQDTHSLTVGFWQKWDRYIPDIISDSIDVLFPFIQPSHLQTNETFPALP